ncbi:MAG: CBASS cGAMP-activated phospholipase [Eubacteriales bacterium]
MLNNKKVVKILTIDGGGIRGIIPSSILNTISKEINEKPLYKCFDLISGTSTGSLIAILLTTPTLQNYEQPPIRTILNLYENEGKKIFDPNWRTIRMFSNIFRAKYKPDSIREIIKYYIGNNTLQDTLTNLIIPAFDMQSMEPFFFKNRPSYRNSNKDVNFYLKDVALAATAAPTYFPPAFIKSINGNNEYCFVDGGLFANNPSLCAYIEARKLFPNADKYIFISLGTGKVKRSYSCKDARNWGLWGWMSPFKQIPILSSFMYGQEGSVNYMLNKTPNVRVYRLNPHLDNLSSDIDDSSEENIKNLKDISYRYVAENDHIIREIANLLARI